MNDSENTQGMVHSTEEIASAGAVSEDRAGTGQYPLPGAPEEQQATAPTVAAEQAAAGGNFGPGDQPHAQLLEDSELQGIRVQWKDIQADFVDEPRKAVQDADALVAELMQRLAQTFASEREQLEARWSGGDDVSTEDLRHGLRRYRSFFERLLAA
jgi:hypothetical protein